MRQFHRLGSQRLIDGSRGQRQVQDVVAVAVLDHAPMGK